MKYQNAFDCIMAHGCEKGTAWLRQHIGTGGTMENVIDTLFDLKGHGDMPLSWVDWWLCDLTRLGKHSQLGGLYGAAYYEMAKPLWLEWLEKMEKPVVLKTAPDGSVTASHIHISEMATYPEGDR